MRIRVSCPPRCRRGLTILEVVVALVILATALIGMAEYQRRYSRTNANSSMLNHAIDLATARLERVKAERSYASIDTMAVIETGIPNYPGYVRTTTILRTAAPFVSDYKTVTVTVTHPSMALPIKKTSAIASF